MTTKKIIDATAYTTDEFVGRHHWRAIQRDEGIPLPVSDEQSRALLVLCADESERSYLRAQIEAALVPAVVDADAAKREADAERLLRRIRLASDISVMLGDALQITDDPQEKFVLAVVARAAQRWRENVAGS